MTSCLAVVIFFLYRYIRKLKIARDRFYSGGHEGKYSSDIRLFSCEFSNRIAEKRSLISISLVTSPLITILTPCYDIWSQNIWLCHVWSHNILSPDIIVSKCSLMARHEVYNIIPTYLMTPVSVSK